MTRPSAMRRHIPALDGLRGVAVLLVLFVHAEALGAPWNVAVGAASIGGMRGVDLFFVLSGFLITRVVVAGERDPRGLERFWARRILRIVPLFLVYVAVLSTVAATTHLLDDPALYRPQGWRLWTSLLLPLPPLGAHQGFTVSPLWSLAVEEHAYLVLPLILRRASRATAARMFAVGIAAAIVLRALLAPLLGLGAVYVLTVTRIDGILVGALVAVGLDEPSFASRIRELAARLDVPAAMFFGFVVGSGSTVGTFRHDHLAWTAVASTLVSLAAATLLVRATDAGSSVARALAARPLAFVGRVSYAVYLFHVLVAVGLARVLPRGLPLEARIVLWLAVTIALAAASFYGFERPISSLGARSYAESAQARRASSGTSATSSAQSV